MEERRCGMSKKPTHFNFPIQLLENFLIDSDKVLEDILRYALYEHSGDLQFGDETEKFLASAKYFGVTLYEPEITLACAEEIYETIPKKSPRSGIVIKTYWQYRNEYKDEFEKLCLLGFLALKSIMGEKPYCKITNYFWLARMDGKTHAVKDYSELSVPLQKYAKRYHIDKIKLELQLGWGLVVTDFKTRGWYASFKLDIKKLSDEVLSNQQEAKIKFLKAQKAAAKKEAIQKREKIDKDLQQKISFDTS
tara:strand:+ start:28853 stop:29602 length:750 start_codon:yes stop_codon:yes gene_type:complete